MPRMLDQGNPVTSPRLSSATRSALAGRKVEFIVNGPEIVVPEEAVAEGDPDSIRAWATRKGATIPAEETE